VARGRFITLEGGEGVGKSTQAAALAEALAGIGLDVTVTREPGGSAGAEAIRALLLGGAEDRWSPEAEALLFAAARADHVEKTIRPALEAGRWVLCDRFLDSSIAYQGYAGKLGADAVRRINACAIGDCLPDRTLVLVTGEGAERARARDGSAADRIGTRGSDYHAAVAAGFEELVRVEPARVRLVDAAGSPEAVTERLLAELSDLLP
jgi:dTMP kinase